MYASLRPRLGVFHFTLAIVFFPFGAPQAQPVPARVRPSTSLTAPAQIAALDTSRLVPTPREIDRCAGQRR